MRQLYKTAGLDLPHASESDKLHRVLSSAIQHRCRIHPPTSTALLAKPLVETQEFHKKTESNCYAYWNAQHFNLQNTRIFQQATPEEQTLILQIASQGLLEEAYFIEKAGVGYMAKMVMLSETIEERMLYALFSADETYHLAQIMRFLPHHQPAGTDDAFLRFLADLVENEDKTVILFVLQVVLEGWGLSHYRTLAKDCQHPEFAQVLTGFLADESRHHATGVTLFKQNPLSPASRKVIVETLAYFLQMIQVGPQRVVAAIEQVLGPLSRYQKIQLFEELETETHSGTRLALLHSLIGKETAGTILQDLEARNAFQPLPAYLCA